MRNLKVTSEIGISGNSAIGNGTRSLAVLRGTLRNETALCITEDRGTLHERRCNQLKEAINILTTKLVQQLEACKPLF